MSTRLYGPLVCLLVALSLAVFVAAMRKKPGPCAELVEYHEFDPNIGAIVASGGFGQGPAGYELSFDPTCAAGARWVQR